MCIEREQPSTALKPMPAYGIDSFTTKPNLNNHEADDFMKLGDIKGEFASKHDPLTGLDSGSGNDRFMGLEDGSGHDRLTGVGPNGFSEVEIHFATPLQENCANGTFLHEGQQGFSEVEIHFCTQIGGNSGPGGTSFMTGYTNGTSYEGMDSTTEVIDVMNNFTNFAMPVGDFI